MKKKLIKLKICRQFKKPSNLNFTFALSFAHCALTFKRAHVHIYGLVCL